MCIIAFACCYVDTILKKFERMNCNNNFTFGMYHAILHVIGGNEHG